MQKKKISLRKAIGKILPHDITKIIPGKFKGPAFKKGHIIRKKDIPEFLKLGKERIWVLKIENDEYHENSAGGIFKGLAGKNVGARGPEEGKVTFFAQKPGVFVVDKSSVEKINRIPDIVLATRHSLVPVKKGEEIAGIRIIPLATKKDRVKKVLAIAKNKLFRIFPFENKKAGLIVTGSEIAKGLISDKFKPVIEEKLKNYKCSLNRFKITADNQEIIERSILEMKKCCDLIILTGGMSVDPDDVTKIAIKKSGARIVSYGAPVLPGNMFLVGQIGKVPIFGVPACAIFHKTTVLDLFMPMALAGIRIAKKDILKRGYGGLCLKCKICRFPSCGFGKY